MNYRHAYHAGNFADVLKHLALTAILLHLRKKETPFAVIDSHAGRGLYDITSGAAAKTGEAKNGILKLLSANEFSGECTGALGEYIKLVEAFTPNKYPGSPLIAAKLLRAKDRLTAIEKHPEEHEALAGTLKPYAQARTVLGDGYKELIKRLPPPERRGVVLIDPPFEAIDEFETAIAALGAARRKFATGIFLLWYPMKLRSKVERAIGELLNGGITRLLQIELDIASSNEVKANEIEDRSLSATGLLVVNPPFGFSTEMERCTQLLLQTLSRGPGANARVERLAGEV
jgi:23S rRNA (adenine2030-N6)-methyltransferase